MVKFIRYKSEYGEKSFKVLPILIKEGLKELRTARLMIDEDEIDEGDKDTIKFHVHHIIHFIHTPVKTMLFFDQRFLDEEEYILYEWACSISTEVLTNIEEEWNAEQQELKNLLEKSPDL